MIWGCILWEEPGYATKIEGKMDAKIHTEIIEDELQEILYHYGINPQNIIFNRIMTPSTPVNWPSTGSKPMFSR